MSYADNALGGRDGAGGKGDAEEVEGDKTHMDGPDHRSGQLQNVHTMDQTIAEAPGAAEHAASLSGECGHEGLRAKFGGGTPEGRGVACPRVQEGAAPYAAAWICEQGPVEAHGCV